MLKIFSRVKVLGLSLVVAICSLVPFIASAVASYGITVSPMNERIILVPGETYKGSFKVSNSSENTGIFKYVVSVKSFYVDENYDIYYDKEENFNQIVNWIKIENPTGELPVNTVSEIKYSVKVPKDAPAGGQYAAIMVQSAEVEDVGGSGAAVQLKQNVGIAHIMYAEVMGPHPNT